MISAERRRTLSPVTLTVVLVVLTTLAGCGPVKVVVDGNFPPPLITPLPVTLGLWYGDDFSKHEFFDEAKGRKESSWIVTTGAAQVEM